MVSQIDQLDLKVVPDANSALANVQDESVALVIFHFVDSADYRGVDGVLGEITRPTLVISDDFRPAEAVQLLKRGIADYMTRPLDLRRLAFLLDALTISARHGTSKHANPSSEVLTLCGDGSFLYGPGEMERLVIQVKALARLDTTLLLCGETGTGKSHLAKLIHELSPRRKQPFVSVDCGALSWRLLESELFGHVKGAFTGADGSAPGKLTSAGSGTLVIEEVDVIPLELQTKFLRAIDERVYEPVGSARQIPLRARLIVTTNRSLSDEVAAGRFRSDLYYRINVVSLELPPLRERKSIIPAMAHHFVEEFAQQQNRSPPMFSPPAICALQSYDWPGNIRELRNVAERCVTLAPHAVIQTSDLPREFQELVPAMKSVSAASNWKTAKHNAEAEIIRLALDRCGNNRSQAARQLGISRVTLYKKLHAYGFM
jgi:two-component system response regulator HydG